MSYLPIEDYGVIGDLRTVALVGKNGSIDFWCFPHFDSPTVFGAILDDAKGGRFQIAPVEPATRKQLYLYDTNVLITRFLSDGGVGEIVDLMPVQYGEGAVGGGGGGEEFEHRIVRLVEVVRGTMTFRVVCQPAFNYARTPHTVSVMPGGALFSTDALVLALETDAPLQVREDGAVVCEITLKQGDAITFEMSSHKAGEPLVARPVGLVRASIEDTARYWRRWLSTGHYEGRWREMVNRSALVLKLLTFKPTGAIVAAATTSLPEELGGARNWDYRFTWIRDASFTLYGLLRVGFTEEAHHFMEWLTARLHEIEADGSLKLMYPINGPGGAHGGHGDALTEQTLDHLEGYRGSRPVRIGNGASGQLQLDIYGELMDAVYLYNKHGSPIGYDLWVKLARVVDWVCLHWQEKDEGIWEVRGGRKHFVYSKVMCWVAVDRALRLAEKRSFPAPRARWLETRDAIYTDIMQNGWSTERESFVQSYGSNVLDASNLIMPLVFFLSPSDPRMTKTLDASMRELVSDSLVYRYDLEKTEDGLAGGEGTFSMCTFWLVEALTRAGRVDEARLIFEKMLTYANHLGLYSEQISRTGEALGNFPQAFTHLSLISAAHNLTRALDRRRRGSQ
jgi:GH15 family glucan-1,4-alpha-glucosidase